MGRCKASAGATARGLVVLFGVTQLSIAAEGGLVARHDIANVNDGDLHGGVRTDLRGEDADAPISTKDPPARRVQHAGEDSGRPRLGRSRLPASSARGSFPASIFSAGPVTKLAAVASVASAAGMLLVLGTMLRLCAAKPPAMTKAVAGSRPRSLALRKRSENVCEDLEEQVGRAESEKVMLLSPAWSTSGPKARQYRLLAGIASALGAAVVLAILAVYYTRPAGSAETGNSGVVTGKDGGDGLSPGPTPNISVSSGPAQGPSVSPGSTPASPVSSASFPDPSIPSGSTPDSLVPSASSPDLPVPSSSTSSPLVSSAQSALSGPATYSSSSSRSAAIQPAPSRSPPRPRPPGPAAKDVVFSKATVHCWPKVCDVELTPGPGGKAVMRQRKLNGVSYYFFMDSTSSAALNAGTRSMDSLVLQWAKQVQAARLNSSPYGTTVQMDFSVVLPPAPRFSDARVHCWQRACDIELKPGRPSGQEIMRSVEMEGVKYYLVMDPVSYAGLEEEKKDLESLLRQWAQQVKSQRISRYPPSGITTQMDFDV